MIKTTVAKEGFEGIYFEANDKKDKVVIVVSGSNGGMSLTKQSAEFYYRNGVSALAVALFKTKGTQKNLDRVPVEYIESAIRWLKELGYKKIGIDGTSKGSEIALFSGTIFPELTCVIARVPSHFVSEGLLVKGKTKMPSGTSCWSYRGEEIPFASYNARKFNLPKILLKEKELHLITINGDKTVKEEHIIPVEKINGPVLLLSSVNDKVWPSYESGLFLEKRLQEKGFDKPFKHIAYPTMSHAMLTEIHWIYRLAFKTERQNKRQCAIERTQLAKELLKWINEVWE